MSPSPQTLSIDDRRIVGAWAADCAEGVLGVHAAVAPDDQRVRAAIDQVRSFAAGELAVGEAVRRRGGAAGAAARDVADPPAKAAAYAAEHAAAVAHMGAHALGAAGYAVKATRLAAGDDEGVVGSAVRRHVASMTDDIARALCALPTLGEDGAGPLGPGRLSAGHVGDAIRAIQAQLRIRLIDLATGGRDASDRSCVDGDLEQGGGA